MMTIQGMEFDHYGGLWDILPYLYYFYYYDLGKIYVASKCGLVL